jgi:hypothetical protein
MFKSHELVVQMKKKPKYNRPSEGDETPAERAKPIDVDKTVDTVMTAAMATIIVYFGCDLIRGVVTHVVVTKVK